MRRSLFITALLALGGAPAVAQQPANETTAALRKNFDEVAAALVQAAELVPADKYSYRPVQPVRSYAQLIAHLADSHNYYCAVAAGKQIEWSDPIEKGTSDKATLVRKVKESVQACNAVYNGSGKAGVLIENLAHTNHHYGNIVTYIRTMGLVPPGS